MKKIKLLVALFISYCMFITGVNAFTITFDGNGYSDFKCHSGWTKSGNKCSKNFTSALTDGIGIVLPKSDNANFKGWYKESSCKTRLSGTTGNISSDITFYACYKKTSSDIGYRYISVDGKNFKCGDRIYITTCNGTSNTSSCNYTKVGTTSASGTVFRGQLKADTADGKSAALAACKTQNSNVDSNKNNNNVSVTKYTITINGNGGKRFACPTGFTTNSTSTTGICNGTLAKNSKFKLPTVDDKNFVGWSKNKSCTGKTESSFQQTVTGHQIYYACYKTVSTNTTTTKVTNIGERYVSVAGSNFKCGDKLYITTCNGTSDTTSCSYTKVNGVSASGTVLRGQLKAGTDLGKQNALAACSSQNTNIKTNEKSINAARWLVSSYNGMICGTPLYIHTCYNFNGSKVCDYSYISNTSRILGQINSNLLTNSIATTNGCSAKGRRYPIVSGKLDSGHSYECGEELYITNCTESICYIGGIGGDNSDKYFGTISKALLKSAQIVIS